jgi:pimeloyl-ACP methyl ester carboxylesterase
MPPRYATSVEVTRGPELVEDCPVTAMQLHTSVVGTGPRVVFVQGSLTTSQQTWAKQAPLAERWTLVIPDRRGYAPNPVADRSDFEVDGADAALLFGDGAHVVGHSYGALGAIFAAARAPDLVRSLTVVETPALSLLRGQSAVEAQIARHSEWQRELEDPREFYLAFMQQMGAPIDALPAVLPAPMEREVRLLMHERPPWEASLPIDALRAARFPKLVVTGGWDPVFEAGSDALAEQLGTRTERAIIPGRGHVVQRTGAPFNEVLEQFLDRAEQTCR